MELACCLLPEPGVLHPLETLGKPKTQDDYRSDEAASRNLSWFRKVSSYLNKDVCDIRDLHAAKDGLSPFGTQSSFCICVA